MVFFCRSAAFSNRVSYSMWKKLKMAISYLFFYLPNFKIFFFFLNQQYLKLCGRVRQAERGIRNKNGLIAADGKQAVCSQ